MKLLKLTFLVALIVSFVACDTEDNCTQSDWTGTYKGTYNCDGSVEDATITITASGDNAIVIETEIADSTGGLTITTDPIEFDGCDFEMSASQGGVTLTTTGNIKGDNLTMTETYSGSTTGTCTTSATRN